MGHQKSGYTSSRLPKGCQVCQVRITMNASEISPRKIQELKVDWIGSYLEDYPPTAVLYYTSWWDFGGIEFEIGGIDPNCRHPKPRPTTPRDFFDLIYFQYQKGNLGNDYFKTHPN